MVNDIAICAEGLRFDSKAGQIGRNVANGSPSLRCFVEAELSTHENAGDKSGNSSRFDEYGGYCEDLIYYLYLLQDATEETAKQGRGRGPSFRLAGVAVSVKTTLACTEDLQPLVDCIPKDPEERKK